MRVSLVHNPAARAGTAPSAEELVALVRAAGHDVTAHSSAAPGWPLQDPGDLLVLAGGDGTVAAALRAIAASGHPAPLATVLPIGTANNIAKAFGLADALPELIRRWPEMHDRPLDVGVVAGHDAETHLFIEAAGVGVLTEMIGELNAGAKRLNDAIRRHEGSPGYVALLRDMLARAHPRPLRVVADGRDLSGEYLLAEVLNVGMVGPNLALAAGADPGDGRLELLLVDEDQRVDMEQWLAARVEGEAGGAPLRSRGVREVELAPAAGEQLRLRRDDGVAVRRGTLSLGVRPGALRMLAP